jgi:hypothetical protein
MKKETAIKLFQDHRVRVEWDDDQEKWFFSIIDVIELLTESPRPRKYWNALKTKLKNEGSELSHKLGQLKMKANESKMRITDEITKARAGLTSKEYKGLKDLKKENLRDNMTNLELVLNMLAEATTTEISKEKKPKLFSESKKITKQGGTIAGNTRKEIEEKTGKSVLSSSNAKGISQKSREDNLE